MAGSVDVGMIVPVLDDARALGCLLGWHARHGRGCPVWVVDGGSADDSVRVAAGRGVIVLQGDAPRGRQMNVGARAALAAGVEVFWFVHADALPPAGAIQAIRAAVARGAVGGAFRRRFDAPSRFLRVTCALGDLRGRSSGWFVGDQALFATAEAFTEADGFPDWPWFEDLELARRLRRVGRTELLDAILTTSGRRFAALGPWRRTCLDGWLMLRYRCTGRPPPLRGQPGARGARGVEMAPRRAT